MLQFCGRYNTQLLGFERKLLYAFLLLNLNLFNPIWYITEVWQISNCNGVATISQVA